jgi:hypothetical protein
VLGGLPLLSGEGVGVRDIRNESMEDFQVKFRKIVPPKRKLSAGGDSDK